MRLWNRHDIADPSGNQKFAQTAGIGQMNLDTLIVQIHLGMKPAETPDKKRLKQRHWKSHLGSPGRHDINPGTGISSPGRM